MLTAKRLSGTPFVFVLCPRKRFQRPQQVRLSVDLPLEKVSILTLVGFLTRSTTTTTTRSTTRMTYHLVSAARAGQWPHELKWIHPCRILFVQVFREAQALYFNRSLDLNSWQNKVLYELLRKGLGCGMVVKKKKKDWRQSPTLGGHLHPNSMVMMRDGGCTPTRHGGNTSMGP